MSANNFQVSIFVVHNGRKQVFNHCDYNTFIFPLRDSLRELGLTGSFPWVEMEDTDYIDKLDNVAYFQRQDGFCDGVYIEEIRSVFIGNSTKELKERGDHRDYLDENLIPEGYLINKKQSGNVLKSLERIVISYEEIEPYRAECARKNIELLKKINDESCLYTINPDKDWGDGIADAFANAGCTRVLIVE